MGHFGDQDLYVYERGMWRVDFLGADKHYRPSGRFVSGSPETAEAA